MSKIHLQAKVQNVPEEGKMKILMQNVTLVDILLDYYTTNYYPHFILSINLLIVFWTFLGQLIHLLVDNQIRYVRKHLHMTCFV